ncbi:endonuclease MutS2 [Clostridiales bacterium BX7]|uniref:Endonuclease MutS2 n=2 Tax=Feifania hominis TaxID=2763660 RepID=A0A926DED0_9FIRM|nr:endonuclease MutS2 [Feifania hominis]
MLAECAATDDAKERIRALTPSGNREEVERRLRETDDAKTLIGLRGGPRFAAVKNVVSAVQRADKGARLSLRELLDVAGVLRTARTLRAYHDDASEVELSIGHLFSGLVPNKYLEELITNSILSEEEIADAASAELARIRRAIGAQTAKAREILQRIIRSTTMQKYLQEPIITMRGDRYVIPVKAEHKNDIPGLVHDTSGSGATYFIEPMSVVEANNELRVLLSKEQDEIERIIAELSAQVAESGESIKTDYDLIVALDVIFAKGKLSYQMKATRPLVGDDGVVELSHARHPLIPAGRVVPIDIRLGGDFDTLVITGPNTGGKTVTLKTLGLLTLMAQAGLHIPAWDGSRVSTFDNLLSDIGDEQSIEQSLSTFSSHMTNIVSIMAVADERTLLLFDELGAGTDPTEGAALAIAILERGRLLGARIAATTHYAELKLFALKTPGVENASCEFDVQSLKPTYKLLIGTPGRSNAFAISAKLGLDAAVIDRAKSLIEEDSIQFEEVLHQLDDKRQQLEREHEQAALLRRELEGERGRLAEQREQFERMRDREADRARQEARRILAAAKHEYAELQKQIDQVRRIRESADYQRSLQELKSKTKSHLSNLDNLVNPVNDSDDGYVLPRPLKIGDSVQIKNIDKLASVLSLPDQNGNMELQAGIIKTKVNVRDVRLVETDKVTINVSKSKYRDLMANREKNAARADGPKSVRSYNPELDLRGMNGDEASLEIDKFLDDCAVAGINQVSLIHGKGTGALRAAVHAFLRGNPHVKSFRLGVYGEGETGVTIVELK